MYVDEEGINLAFWAEIKRAMLFVSTLTIAR